MGTLGTQFSCHTEAWESMVAHAVSLLYQSSRAVQHLIRATGAHPNGCELELENAAYGALRQRIPRQHVQFLQGAFFALLEVDQGTLRTEIQQTLFWAHKIVPKLPTEPLRPLQ